MDSLVPYSKSLKLDELFIKNLKAVYSHTRGASYLGGSLCLSFQASEKTVIFNLREKKKYSEIDYWVAKIYLKERSQSGAFFDLAAKIIKNYAGEVTLAKELLKRQC
jgi:hypothetical protein